MPLVTIEGLDGAGKTTLATGLADALPGALLLREPGGVAAAERVRELVKAPDLPAAAAMPTTFDVDRFEHVAATPETALLRLSGRWQADQRERLSPPMLVIDDGRRTHRLPALPGPEDAAPLAGPEAPRWRAAFS